MAKPKRNFLAIGGIAIGVLLLLVVGGWFARNAIATSMARSDFEERGLVCDDRFSVELSGGFSEATLGPTRCTRSTGVIEAIELLEPAAVALSGTEATAMDVRAARVSLRADRIPGDTGWAPSLARASLEAPVASLVTALSELAQMRGPSLTIARLDISRGGRALGTGQTIAFTPGEAGLDVGIRQLTFPTSIATATLSNVRGHAGHTDARLQGSATASAQLPFGIALGQRSGLFDLSAEGLQSTSPRFSLRGQI
ncbi:MAG: hypothetical protein AB7S26_03955 [Sandaracinaceae bacterium]